MAIAVFAVTAQGQAKPDAGNTPGAGPVEQASPPAQKQKPAETRLTPAQAKELFRSVDDILQFASTDSRLPIRHEVKRKLQTRASVEKYVVEKFNDDEDTKRMQRSEIVLKKFGLLDRDFQLKPFLVSLLTEQIAGYYDSKTKTVNLLDWIEPDSQKPVLAHELTHALQDQHVNLDKWENKTLSGISKNMTDDNLHLATDEADSAREAVLEGQAMAVFVDYSLKPSGKTLLNSPDMGATLKDLQDSSDSPVMARAPLLLQESLLFPYREGLNFEQTLMKDKGVEMAFAGVLDRPPSTSYEIMNPKAYERRKEVPLLKMPDVHGLLDEQYDPYDVGVMGALDVRILTELFGGEQESEALTPEWNGGLYFAAQKKNARTAAEKESTGSVALVYFSAWKSPEAAKAFAAVYAAELSKKYSGVTRDQDAESGGEQVYKTNEGPVLIANDGSQVFISESFDLTLARKMELLLTGAQPDGDLQTAQLRQAAPDLADGLVHLFASCGMMKAALPH